jgi:ribosome maturation protein SDO1
MRVNQPVGIVEMTNIAIIKYRTSTNQKFEIACYKNKAINWRNGVEKDLRYWTLKFSEVLQVYEIFTNATKGDVASSKELLHRFETTEKDEIIKIILEKGDL